jgi:hypothetical protein
MRRCWRRFDGGFGRGVIGGLPGQLRGFVGRGLGRACARGFGGQRRGLKSGQATGGVARGLGRGG